LKLNKKKLLQFKSQQSYQVEIKRI